MTRTKVPKIEDFSKKERRDAIAENMKERVYATITLLAVLTIMWQNADHRTVIGTIGTVIGVVVALWLARLIATRISHRAVHERPITAKEYVKTLFTASGLLVPAILPTIILVVGGMTEWFTLKTALFVSMIISLLFLFAQSFYAARKIYDNFGQLLLVSALEMLVGVGIILLKIVTGE
jgi:hypothetical protein|tara:strand:- start:4793 stop:5329 length:537 start_codon:yes stop_codon:yes gene_type:complete